MPCVLTRYPHGGAEVRLSGAGQLMARVRIGGAEAIEVTPDEASGDLIVIVPGHARIGGCRGDKF